MQEEEDGNKGRGEPERKGDSEWMKLKPEGQALKELVEEDRDSRFVSQRPVN